MRSLCNSRSFQAGNTNSPSRLVNRVAECMETTRWEVSPRVDLEVTLIHLPGQQ